MHALLFEQADERVAIWASGATPFDVDFGSSEAVILEGSEGVHRSAFGSEGLALQSSGEPIALALRLPRGGLMQSRLVSVSLSSEASEPVSWQLIGFSPLAQQMGTIASGSLDTDSHSSSELHEPDWSVMALQLRLEAPAGTSIRLKSLRFSPDFVTNPELRCYYGREPYGWAGCSSGNVRLVDYPEDSLGETLSRNDNSHELFPGAAIEPAESGNDAANAATGAMRGWLRAARSDTGLTLIYGAIVLFSLLAVVICRRGMATSRNFGTASLLLLLGAMLLPAGGLPDDTFRPGLLAVFGGWLLAAIWLGSRSTSLDWLGNAAAWRAAALLTFAGFCLLVLLSSGHRQPPELNAALRYLPWVALQQWLLQRLIRPMAESWTNDRVVAISGSALCFGLLHFPNPALMLFSALGAAGWCWLAQRHRTLLPLILSHWFLGLAALTFLSPTLLRNAEIGSRFLMPR
ncbi:MAG: type II CAAX endopeptidase family protein [Lysobacteraceae bacterium]